MSDGKKRKNVFRVIKLMRKEKKQKSLNTCDGSSQPAIKGKGWAFAWQPQTFKP